MLKKESRILGISGTRVRDRFLIVGLVFRGSLWLDGVVTSSIDAFQPNYNPEISRMIRSTKQFPQLHAIIVSRCLARCRQLKIAQLARKVGLPVIAIRPVRRSKFVAHANSQKLELTVNRKHLTLSIARASTEQARRLYEIGCAQVSGIPEAVRLADVLVDRLRLLERETRHRSTKRRASAKAISSLQRK